MAEKTSQAYRQCVVGMDIPLYFQPHWLDAVAGPDGWDAALAYDKGGHVTGVWVYCPAKYWGLPIVKMPPLTAYSGPYLFYPHNLTAPESRYAFEKRVMNELMDQLPQTAFFYQEWHPDVQNWLPACWRGFNQTTRYTYRLDDLSDWNAVFDRFRSNVRTHIRKAEKEVRVFESDEVEVVYRLHEKSMRKQGKYPAAPLSVLQGVDAAMSAKAQRLALLAEGDSGALHAGLYLVWDAHTAYYLLSGADPSWRNSGALYLLVWDALQFCSRKGLAFDFEGSMLEPVEEVFRGFGGRMVPHHKLFRAQNRLLKAMSTLLGKGGY